MNLHPKATVIKCRGYIEGGLPLNIMEGQGIGLSEMINAMAAQQHIYTAAAYGGIEAAAYAPYPQYVTQGPYVTTAARPVRDNYESFNGYEPERRKERRDREERRRDRDRDRDRDRRDRDRDRDRDRRDRDRDRDREHRWRDDNRDRSPHRDRRDRDRDYDRDRDRDRDRDGGYDDDHGGSSGGSDYKTQPPNNTIMVRGLAQHITENDIRADILACNLMPKDIRLVRKKESGASRGFAFVEFTTVHDATRWMEAKQGVLILQDMYRATLQYSIPKESSERHAKASQDWFCIKCGAHNFKRRDSCFKCSAPRHESEAGNEGSDEVCTYPTNTLLMRGLDILSTEESVLQGIQHAGSDLPIRSVRIGRDSLTNTSRGVCYIELNSVMDSMQLHNKLVQSPPVIDGKQVTISYCKLSQNTGSGSGSGTYGNWSQHQPAEYTAGADIKQLAEYSASLYAQSPEEHSAYVQYYTQYYQQQAQAYQQGQQQQQQSGTQSDSVNAAAAVAQSALQAMQQKSSAPTITTAAATAAVASATPTTYSATVTTTTTSTEQTLTTPTGYESQNSSDYQTYPTPNVSAYQYDESSGYYYDPSTGLYYDANSQYYYNSETGQYMYWDAEKSTYMPAPAVEDGDGKEKGDKKDKEKDKQEKVKVAKKIAKDMQRWAKAQNKRNESAAVKVAAPEPAGGSTRGGGAADAAFAVLVERKDRASLVEKQAQVFQMHLKKDPSVLNMSSLKKPSGLVAAYGGEGSDSEEEPSAVSGEDRSEEKLIDLTKMACLLCKRQFPNREALNRHVQLSDLHKKNLEGMRKSKEGPNLAGLQYRDRAKERRQKYGEPEVPPPNRLKEKYMAAREEASSTTYEEPTKKGIGSDNIGNKLLKKMGWSDGQGLGKANQGRTSIIETERRVATAGLGMQGSTYSVVGDSYKECVKKMMFHRYQELDALEKEAAKNGSV
ncbi:RNA-binding protein 5-like isoform X2 [Oratosquilla oratoria]|uniref:RNA-binding protein 5-like isoform X2 n=1 Tax=Oratosquilla oratoria TaxID=337810 RepID=UPI003F762B0C